MDRKHIVMNFSAPPGIEDIEAIAEATIETLPEELSSFTEGLVIQVEDMPDEHYEQELGLEDPYELVALYRSGNQISPGIESKVANDDDVLVLFRRPLLDLWCETCEDLNTLIRQVMIEELGQNFEFSDDEIDEMTQRHHQGLL